MDLVEVMGKRNRKVPVLLTPPMKSGIESLIHFRETCGVHPENIYVFAKVIGACLICLLNELCIVNEFKQMNSSFQYQNTPVKLSCTAIKNHTKSSS